MKSVLSIILSLFISINVFSQFSISGQVIDKSSGQPLPAANVKLLNNLSLAVTDIDGNFKFSKLSSGNYTVQVSYIGYETSKQSVKLISNQKILIRMPTVHIMQDEVIVVGVKAGNETPGSRTNISKEELEENNTGKDLPFLLELTPSLVATSDAGAGVGYTSMRIRGSDISRINVTLNGIPLNDPESQGVWWVDLPDLASSLDQVEIQRGIGTSSNGSGAFGASINMQTDKLRPDPYTYVHTSYGSFSTLKSSTQFGTGLIKEHWTLDAKLSKILSDGYIDRAFSNMNSLYLSGGYYGKKSILRLLAIIGKEHTYQSWYGVPQDSLLTNRTYNYYTYDNQTDNYWQDNYQALYSVQLTPSLLVNTALHYTWGRGYYEEMKKNQSYADYQMPDVIVNQDTLTRTDLIRQKWLDNDFYGGNMSISYEAGRHFHFDLGSSYSYYNGSHYGKVIWAKYASMSTFPDRYYDNKGIKTDFNNYLKVNLRLAHGINFYADVQYRKIDYRFRGFDDSLISVDQQVILNFINPKGGINWRLNSRNKIYASWAMSNHEPGRDEYVQSSPTSRPLPENMKDIEAGYAFTGNHLRVLLNYYRMDYKNQLVLTGQINDVGAYIRHNVGKSMRQGMELSLSANILKHLNLNINFAYSQNKLYDYVYFIDNYDNGSQVSMHLSTSTIAFSPAIISSGRISWEPVKHLKTSWTSKYVGKQYLDNTQDETKIIQAYLIHDFQIAYHINRIKIFEGIDLSISIFNLLNKLYESNGYTYSYIQGGQTIIKNFYYPQAGRHYQFGLLFKI